MTKLNFTEDFKYMPVHLLVDGVCSALKEAMASLMSVYRGEFEVEYKEDDTPLTYGDRLSNKILCSKLAELTPEIPIISEEGPLATYEERSLYSFCWLLDPLDGTKEFIARNDEFCINLALIFQHQSVAGFVGIPATRQIAWAVKGQGAYLENENGPLCRLECASFRKYDTGVRIVTSRSHPSAAVKDFINQFDEPVIMQKGSALKQVMIANSQADIYPRFGPTMEWDTAAPQIILEEAGGSVISMIDGRPLRYNKTSVRNPEFVAKGREVQ